MRTTQRSKGYLEIKIDLEKAYDRLSWDFIKYTLKDISLPTQFIDLVWNCIHSAKIKMLQNNDYSFIFVKDISQGTLAYESCHSGNDSGTCPEVTLPCESRKKEISLTP